MELSRRKLFTGVGLLIAAPVIVRAASLMPINPAYGFVAYDCPITGEWIDTLRAHHANLGLHSCVVAPKIDAPLSVRAAAAHHHSSLDLDSILDRALGVAA